MNQDVIRVSGDITSLSVVIATLLKLLPPLAALASLVWTCIQVYEWYKKKYGSKTN